MTRREMLLTHLRSREPLLAQRHQFFDHPPTDSAGWRAFEEVSRQLAAWSATWRRLRST